MKFSFIYRPEVKRSHYKPVFYNPEEEERKSKLNADNSNIPLKDRIERKWDKERKYKSIDRQKIVYAFAIIVILIYLIFFL